MNGAHVALIGRVTRAGELRVTPSGHQILKIGVLIEDSRRKDGDPADFADVTLWNELADEMADRLPKGAEVYIEGRAKVRAWAGRDGAPKATMEISVWKCEPLGQIGRSAPRRTRGPVGDPVQLGAGNGGRRMPEAMAVGAVRNTRQQLGLDDSDLEDTPF